MPTITITCSRCGKQVEGLSEVGMSAGYYSAAAWADFANEGETEICDECMWADPRYIAVYGNVKAVI